jgi:hypothetical protein
MTFLRLCAGIALLAMATGCEDDCKDDCRDDYNRCIDDGGDRTLCQWDRAACEDACETGDEPQWDDAGL